jgi:hypothetical protein
VNTVTVARSRFHGVGIRPDIEVPVDASDLANGIDRDLLRAIALFQRSEADRDPRTRAENSIVEAGFRRRAEDGHRARMQCGFVRWTAAAIRPL